MIQSTLNNKKQAINDFNICVNLTDAEENLINSNNNDRNDDANNANHN